MPDELTKALLLEEAASEDAIAEALFASVTRGAPLVHALVEARAVTPEVLARYLARTETPYLRHVVPVAELVDALDRRIPGFRELLDDSVFNFAVNDEMLLIHARQRALHDGDVVEVIPTISGG